MDKDAFTRYFYIHEHHNDKKVESVDINLLMEGIEAGEVLITDLQLQEGMEVTGTVPATEDFLHKVRSRLDESRNAVGDNDTYLKQEPRDFQNIEKRFFNLFGRGFETVSIPNVYHEDTKVEILTTGLDLTLYPKNNYDFVRITSFYGEQVKEEDYTYSNESLTSNPLNTRYTREFCFGGGKAGDKIELLSSEQVAKVNGQIQPLGVQRFPAGVDVEWGEPRAVEYTNRQRFMILPVGSVRINIQFMTFKEEDGLKYLIDDGVGFSGLAEFTQWKEGVSKF